MIEKQLRKNNVKGVFEILGNRFKEFRTGIKKDLPDESIGNVVKRTLQVNTFLDFLPLSDHPAIITPTPTTTTSIPHITHNQVYEFIKSLDLAKFNIQRGDRVAVCLPNGPSLNLCLLSVMSYCTCVPSNSQLTPDELLNDYKHLKVKVVIVPYEKLINHESDALVKTLRRAGLQLIGLKTFSDSNIKFILYDDPADIQNNNTDATKMTNGTLLNQADDVVMIFQTSGTTGQKKIVPYRLCTLCTSTVCVAFSLDIKHTDTNVNMMPLFHVGGIIRNLLAPLLCGGSIIQCQVNNLI